MARLIDADDCGRYIASCMGFGNAGVEDILQYMAEYTEQNEVNAVEVVHGRWEKSEYNGFVRCDKCKDVYIDESWLTDGKWNYCPNCGAKMDGERKDNERKAD